MAARRRSRHAEATTEGGATLELDNTAMVRLLATGAPEPPQTVLGFALPSSEVVDETFARLTTAGYAGQQPPYDAFRGARDAIVADPDGNSVGLMDHIDRTRGYVPTPLRRT